ncbi:ABC superfamily ATP binding cassette transporter, ABC protein [Schaalia cardiffensis F0333]|uniref:ABC superfamily ATP binding cassette transporter, ABC protein n=1 Tax=Schaalia cardiffensis F0333 TaxID=888050 RepID=N6X870_9ACTO|nr:ABC-F family ATP-binding cassette domain-containing protein [Schaalia cardiffensis]ENO17363.1 ABC superfamily ATP binding cassette transporter, ABC protein [Schaalia cardiffensis F0333]
MAHLLGTQSLSVLAGSRKLLEEVTLGVEDSSRIGILGPNGAGKSTLLRLIAGLQEPDGGQITKREGVTVLVLDQADHLDPSLRVVDAVHPGLDEYEWASDPVIRDIHAGLLADIRLDAEVGTLSGGQRRRVALAKVLAAPSDIVCLDEPTNHLDIEGVAWLAAHLNARFAKAGAAGALLVVTHDRWFLDTVCEHIWEVVPGIDPGGDRPQIPGHVDVYEGSYAAYTLARAERARQADVAAHKRANLLTKELAWLRRGAPARTSKPKFHIAAAEALIADVPPPRDTVELVKMASARLGKDVLDFEELSLAFTRADGTKNTILDEVTWRLAPAERVGIVGVNGAGKTTLLNLLRGDLHPDSGRVKRGKTVKVATLSQDTHELDALADMRVVEAVAQVSQTCRVDGREISAMQMSERMGFTRQRAYTRICEVSGGERRRLQLMRLLMAEPNILLLDEPTNDLDTDTLAAMEDLLDSFPGTLVVVSHDRYLLERVTDHQVALLGDGKLHALPGGVEQYLAIREQGQREDSSTSPRAQADVAQSPLASEAKASSRLKGAARHAAQKEANRIERRVEKLRAQCAQVEEQLAQLGAAVAREAEAIEELEKVSVEHSALIAQIDELEEAWLEAAELLD